MSDYYGTILGLINPKSPENVGAVMRAAGCFEADSVFYTGQRYAKAARFNTDTKSVARRIPLTGVANLLESVPDDYSIVCVELVEGAESLRQFQHPPRGFYIFGAEDGTIEQGIIDKADSVVYVPTVGCLNLAASVNILLYDRQSKNAMHKESDELIRTSRDTNNRVKVRL